MISANNWLHEMVAALPDTASITVPVATVREWLQGSQVPKMIAPTFVADLTADEIAQALGKKPSTVRGWLNAGQIPDAYKLNGKEWRVPVEALNAFQGSQRESQPAPRLSDRGAKRLGDWRR
jgi:excisionase family DNA binding protein